MTVRRFFVEPSAVVGGAATLDAAERDHAVRVLRLAPGDEVELFDGAGREYSGRILEYGKHIVRVSVGEARPCAADPAGEQVRLLPGLPRLARVDWLVEKGTEAGLARFVPVLARRSPPEARRAAGRASRWRTIARQACRQCGRAQLPQIDPPVESGSVWPAWTGEKAGRAILDPKAPLLFGAWLEQRQGPEWVVAVGPEGGWDEEELRQASEAGFDRVGLGRRILRAETAGLVAVAAVHLLRGDLKAPPSRD